MHFNGLKLGGALEEFALSSQFLGQKCKNQSFEVIKRFESSFFYRIGVQVITQPFSRLEKHQTFDFFLCLIFYDFFKMSISAFSDISENHQLHILKSLQVYHLMLPCKTKHNTA